eukprot:4218827-Pleurochrysis_carterae.AAC.2
MGVWAKSFVHLAVRARAHVWKASCVRRRGEHCSEREKRCSKGRRQEQRLCLHRRAHAQALVCARAGEEHERLERRKSRKYAARAKGGRRSGKRRELGARKGKKRAKTAAGTRKTAEARKERERRGKRIRGEIRRAREVERGQREM